MRPDIRHGSFTLEEEDLIVKLHAAHGSRYPSWKLNIFADLGYLVKFNI